jgi:chromosome partitioning protein
MATAIEQHTDYWTVTDIQKLFRIGNKIKSRQTLLNAEERGEIPMASRVSRGSTQVRKWNISQLPAIGSKYGFLKKPVTQQIVCIYTTKGGVLKTTSAYTIGRALALNGIKTCIIGCDIQCSITDLLLQKEEAESIEEYSHFYKGLYQLLYEKATLKDVVHHTELPTLDLIPESPQLSILEKKLRLETRREYIFKDKLIPKLKDYDVIIFDNGPSWNQLIENALTCSNNILSPIGCDIGTFQALKTNLDALYEFQDTMDLKWDTFLLLPTLLEKTKLSQQIYGTYLNQLGENVITTPIRRAVKGQEAMVVRRSAIEHDPTSSLAQDYYEFLQQYWNKLVVKD